MDTPKGPSAPRMADGPFGRRTGALLAERSPGGQEALAFSPSGLAAAAGAGAGLAAS
ncbi:hypothetical protein GA0115244_12309 [Streptomyces sp. DvalAA-19]|nr:hypothetical protein GA0115244_12309 [Streptomyces sp. DvalAA-19]